MWLTQSAYDEGDTKPETCSGETVGVVECQDGEDDYCCDCCGETWCVVPQFEAFWTHGRGGMVSCCIIW